MKMIETDNLLTWLSRSGYVWTYILNPLKLSNLTFSQKAGGGTYVRTFFYLFVFLSFVRIYIEKCDIFAMREDDISI